jgi:hypothetical protein
VCVSKGSTILDELTLRDLLAELDTFVVLEEEREKEKLEEDEARVPSAKSERGCEPKSAANARNWGNGSEYLSQLGPKRPCSEGGRSRS